MIKSNLPIQVQSLDQLSTYNISKIAVAIGIFDGVHLGHRQIIKELIDLAEKHSAVPVVITFSPHPRQLLFPQIKFRFLRSSEKKAQILASLGVKAVVTIPFERTFAELEPDDFLKELVHSQNIELSGICVGTKWRFGAGAKGNEDTLKMFSQKYGFEFRSVKEVFLNQSIVSSTEIRKALAKGNFNTANEMLDCRYKVSGYICNTENYLGKDDFNIFIKYGVLPPVGAYKAYLNGVQKAIFLDVVSETKLMIPHKYLSTNKNKVEIEFKEAV